MVDPLLVKASAGGGGRGMRIVRLTDDLPEAVESARREALSAFGDGTVFVEPLLERARHIEVQILADRHGTVWALGERECSIQRRHQKVVEETPSPAISPETRERLCDAAIKAAKTIGYVGAGTVEFLVKGDTVAFLEMNTRLQVEHPVTECVYGVDLVELQLRIAEGTRLAASPPRPSGHAVEVRLYAEDPARDWLPQSGTLHRFDVPGVDARFAPMSHGLRLDSGVKDGSEIGVHYDPMLAKVISYGASRTEAVRRLATALANARIHGPVTNRDLLVRVLRHEAFLDGDTHTGFLDEHDLAGPAYDPAGPVRDLAGPGQGPSEPVHDLAEPEHDPAHASTGPAHDPAWPTRGPSAGPRALSALAAALASAAANRAAATVQAGLPSGWRNVVSQPQRTAFAEAEVAYRISRDGLRAEGLPHTNLVSATPALVVLETSGVRHRFAVARYDGVTHVDSPSVPYGSRPCPGSPNPSCTWPRAPCWLPCPVRCCASTSNPATPSARGRWSWCWRP